MATRIIRIASSKPSAVFGVPHPTDTIQRWLQRHYTSQHFTARSVWLGSIPIFMGATIMWYISRNFTGPIPKSISKEWKEANAIYDVEQGSDTFIFENAITLFKRQILACVSVWKVGTPVPVPTRPISWLREEQE